MPHVASAKLCLNCLNPNHAVDSCNFRGRCIVCGGKHHTKLYREGNSTSNQGTTGQHSVVAHATTETVNGISISTGNGVLPVAACVVLESSLGQRITVRALLDSGAEECFLTKHVAQALSLRKRSKNTAVSCVGGETNVVARNSVKVCLKSAHDANFSFEFSALILKKLYSTPSVRDSKANLASFGRNTRRSTLWSSSASGLHTEQYRVCSGYSSRSQERSSRLACRPPVCFWLDTYGFCWRLWRG